MTLRQEFFQVTSPKHSNFFNKSIEWHGLKLATVMWHQNREWKVVDTLDWDIVKDFKYKPVAAFHTQQELWEYVKTQVTA